MTLVVDASMVVAGLVDSGPDGTWADQLLADNRLAAPHLMLVEAENTLRRAAHVGDISDDTAASAHADLLNLRVQLFTYRPFASRVWQLRHSVTAYDGWYVAIAEELGAFLATLDHRLAAAPGPRCEFVTAPGI